MRRGKTIYHSKYRGFIPFAKAGIGELLLLNYKKGVIVKPVTPFFVDYHSCKQWRIALRLPSLHCPAAFRAEQVFCQFGEKAEALDEVYGCDAVPHVRDVPERPE